MPSDVYTSFNYQLHRLVLVIERLTLASVVAYIRDRVHKIVPHFIFDGMHNGVYDIYSYVVRELRVWTEASVLLARKCKFECVHHVCMCECLAV